MSKIYNRHIMSNKKAFAPGGWGDEERSVDMLSQRLVESQLRPIDQDWLQFDLNLLSPQHQVIVKEQYFFDLGLIVAKTRIELNYPLSDILDFLSAYRQLAQENNQIRYVVGAYLLETMAYESVNELELAQLSFDKAVATAIIPKYFLAFLHYKLDFLRYLEQSEQAKAYLVHSLKQVFQADLTTHGLPNILSQRETQVLNGMSKGLLNKEIAYDLGVSVNTVKNHVRNIFEKLEVNNRIKALAKAAELGLVS